MTAEELANKLREKYELTCACSVNLEGTINNMLKFMPIEEIENTIEDILDHVNYVPEMEDL